MKYFKRPEFQLPIYFITIGIIWIVCSDLFFSKVQNDVSSFHITGVQTIKGILFVILAALFLHFMIKSLTLKLAKSEEEYKDLFYNTPNPMFVYDSTTKKFYNVNKAAIETYGYTEDEFTEMAINDVRVTNEQSHDPMKVNTCNLKKHRKKNSEIIICQETTRKISIKNQPACLLSALDVTEHEKAKAELQHSEGQLKQVLNSITDGFFILNYDLTVTKANEHFKNIVEVPVDMVEGKKLHDLFPSLRNGESFNKYRDALEKHNSAHFESYHSRTGMWYRVSVYPFDGGVSVFFRNITKEKDDEFHNYQNEQNLLALINNTEDLIWSIDSNYRYFTFNEPYQRGYQQLFGEDIWVGKTALNEKGGEEHVKKWKELYGRALRGEKFSTEMEFLLNNSSQFTTVRFNPIYNAEHKVIGAGCFLQNITERKLHERKIQQQNEKLKEIAFITSHKVRVPLANILGLTEILDMEDPLSKSNSQIIDHLKTSARQLDFTISNMVRQTAKIDD